MCPSELGPKKYPQKFPAFHSRSSQTSHLHATAPDLLHLCLPPDDTVWLTLPSNVLNLTGNSCLNTSTRFKHWMILECFSQEGKSSKMHKKQSWMMALSQVAFTSFSLDLEIRLTWHSWLTYLVSCANRLPPVAISKLLFHMASSSSLRADCTSRSLTSPVRCWEWLTLTNYCSTNCCVVVPSLSPNLWLSLQVWGDLGSWAQKTLYTGS